MTSDRPNSNCPRRQLERETSPKNSEVRLTPVSASAESNPTLVLLGQVAEDVAALRKEVAALTATKAVFDNSTGGEFISLNDAAKKFGVSVKTVRRMVATGKLKSYRLPGKGRMRLKVTEVDDALVRIPDPTARKV